MQPTPAPAPPRDESLTAEQQRLNEALHAEDPEAKAARSRRPRRAARDERLCVAARAEDERRRRGQGQGEARAAGRQRAEDLKRKAKREARRRESGEGRRLALWDPAEELAPRPCRRTPRH